MLHRDHIIALVEPHTAELLTLRDTEDGRRELEYGIKKLLSEKPDLCADDYTVECNNKVNDMEAVAGKYLCFSIYEKPTLTCFDVMLGDNLFHVTRTTLEESKAITPKPEQDIA